MDEIEEYYVVPAATYLKCINSNNKQTEKEFLSSQPVSAAKKMKTIMNILRTFLNWDEYGNVKSVHFGEEFNIFEMLVPAVRSQGKELKFYKKFLVYMYNLGVPLYLLSTKAHFYVENSRR